VRVYCLLHVSFQVAVIILSKFGVTKKQKKLEVRKHSTQFKEKETKRERVNVRVCVCVVK
jgi:hypothetical protein